ncbi:MULTISPECIES: hypothetical protein [Micromonospora]|uniref:Uncharacterized protein n=1 Tax=Micromonospora solifontis TaxID=2487138 RepID=A0ABX9WFL2_9ACTN|nr:MULTISPECIES: hypothetical protein [Micromonospora]NES12408.1 hypothetical protein [Micromonospora sp. PPF5-17B]NES37140.1 hypothetical protein [Micromonospora solifontis]NES54109.1 hypothetical protein [Micromonospora sp. PPF5-6]RNL98693.1 hypothetical protein EFE23_13385 [Micromonospora solifontis]
MRGSRVMALCATSALVLGVLQLTLPATGSDMSAQVARAGFFAEHGPALVDLRWYGGVHPWGYSLLSPPLMALLGVRLTGALALLASATAFAALLVRTRVPRPLLGGLVGVLTIAANLVSGRVTYALGVAFGLAALLALTLPTGVRWRWPRAGLAVLAALLASAASPVAGLFVGLAGVALLLTRRYADGLLLAAPAAAPLAVTGLLFGEGGWMNISRTDTLHAVLTSLLVAALVGYRPVRVGALLSAAGVLAAALVHTPVGLNATRLVVMFALPVLAASAALPRRLADRLPQRVARHRVAGAAALAVLLATVCWWQPPVVAADLRSASDPTADPAYFAPLRAELARRGLTGRVEVPPTRNYWEAAHLGEVPLARGWLRQADIARNPLFFTTVPGARGTGVALTPASYRAWLTDNAVEYVAVPDAELSWVGRAETRLIEDQLPYLRLVWASQHWQLYSVAQHTSIVEPPATLISATSDAVTVSAPSQQRILLRIRYSRWLTSDPGGILTPAGTWTALRTSRPGIYTIHG